MTRLGALGFAIIAVVCATLPAPSWAACPAGASPCATASGSYHAVLPEGPAKGAMMFLHGWGSTGEGSLRLSGMVQRFTERGYVVLAPNGTPRTGRSGRSWAFHPDRPGPRDEIAFLAEVRDDAAARFGFAPDKVLLAGFSIGGSMASYVACFAPESFAAYAPVGGGMWRPHPERCAGPVRLLHTHGWADGTVPLEGRAVSGTEARSPDAFVQGDVFETLEIWRVANGCVNHMPDEMRAGDPFWRRIWQDCAAGSALEFALFPGGHAMPRGWSDLALDWFETQLDAQPRGE